MLRLFRGFSLAIAALVVFRLRLSGQRINPMLAILLHEVGKILHRTRTGVFNRGILRSSREQFDSRKARDRIGDVVGCGINLSNSYLG